MLSSMQHIRNFCIIAHIDHGKSTLADRLLEATGTLSRQAMQDQVLDNMDLERERGITIKSHAIQMAYTYEQQAYVLNLIDTPGHVDFSYEVSRAMAACEGGLLVVDVAQGIEAQTLSNLYLALQHNLSILPVLNKIDLPGAETEAVKAQVIELLGCAEEDILYTSAKESIGIEALLAAVVTRVPPPKGNPEAPLQAMAFDSYYNSYRGVVVLFRVFNGSLHKGQEVRFMHSGRSYEAQEVGILRLNQYPEQKIPTGGVGYLVSGIKNAQEVRVGDTLTDAGSPAEAPLQGFSEVKPMVFAGLYPLISSDFEDLRTALEKLQLSDAALSWEPETSQALGFGFRCGFLGMLHMEIVQERLRREFEISVITTVPSVRFLAHLQDGNTQDVSTPAELPGPMLLNMLQEPFIRAQIISKTQYIGPIIELCMSKRGLLKNQNYLTTDRVELGFELPLAEIVFDFYDKLKSISRGYASFDYELLDYRTGDLVKLDMLLNKDKVDALSSIIHRQKAYEWGKRLCEKLRELIPRQLFEVAIQAAIGSKVIARETVKPLRKNVIAKCYGGDITRKRKLLEKQKEGKKKMRQIGNVEVPQEAFMAVLKF